MFNFKKKSIFDTIDTYLSKQNHELVMSLYLDNYNGCDIFVRFDYCRDIMAYKVVWVDLKFINVKKIDKYINKSLVTTNIANKLVEALEAIDLKSDIVINEDIIGDRVEFINYQHYKVEEYVFNRFLPLKWKALIDPIVLLFTYMPRSMEAILNEIFAKFDGCEERYNALKPIKFDLLNDERDVDFFKPNVMAMGRKEFLNDKVTFLEKMDNKYVAIVEGMINSLVVIRQIDDTHVHLWCNCKCDIYCKHIYAVILAIRNNKFNDFYKVTYTGRGDETLLEKLADGSYNLCYGVDGDNLLVVGNDYTLRSFPLLDHKGKCVFKVIEDDDNKSLSKIIDEYNKN